MVTVVFFQGDTPTLQVQFFEEDGKTPLNIANATIYFYMKDSDGKERVNRPMSIIDDKKGITQIILSSSETDWFGSGIIEFESRFLDGTVLTLAQISVQARKQLRE